MTTLERKTQKVCHKTKIKLEDYKHCLQETQLQTKTN